VSEEKIRDAGDIPEGSGEARKFLFESDNRDRAVTFLFWTIVSALAVYRVWEALR